MSILQLTLSITELYSSAPRQSINLDIFAPGLFASENLGNPSTHSTEAESTRHLACLITLQNIDGNRSRAVDFTNTDLNTAVVIAADDSCGAYSGIVAANLASRAVIGGAAERRAGGARNFLVGGRRVGRQVVAVVIVNNDRSAIVTVTTARSGILGLAVVLAVLDGRAITVAVLLHVFIVVRFPLARIGIRHPEGGEGVVASLDHRIGHCFRGLQEGEPDGDGGGEELHDCCPGC